MAWPESSQVGFQPGAGSLETQASSTGEAGEGGMGGTPAPGLVARRTSERVGKTPGGGFHNPSILGMLFINLSPPSPRQSPPAPSHHHSTPPCFPVLSRHTAFFLSLLCNLRASAAPAACPSGLHLCLSTATGSLGPPHPPEGLLPFGACSFPASLPMESQFHVKQHCLLKKKG